MDAQKMAELDQYQDLLIHPEDEKDLIQRGLLDLRDEKRALSVSTILSDSSTQSEDSGIDTSLKIEIPERLQSVESYQYLGFERLTASTLMNRWQDFPSDGRAPQGPYTFDLIAIGHIDHVSKEIFERVRGDRLVVLQHWGINKELRDVFALEKHQALLDTTPLDFWVQDVITRRWNSLCRIWQESRDRFQHDHALNKRRRVGVQYETIDSEEESILGLRGGYGEKEKNRLLPENTPGKTLLWRGGDKDRFDKFFKYGKIDDLQSRWPSDFRGVSGPTLYFALEYEVAHRYKEWAKHTAPTTTAVIWMEVPNSVISASEPCILRSDGSISGRWRENDWKQIVFASRQGYRFPKNLSHLQSCPLFIGHICCKDNDHINKLSQWEEITTKKHAWNLAPPGEEPYYTTQYVFNGSDMADKLRLEAEFGFVGETKRILPEVDM